MKTSNSILSLTSAKWLGLLVLIGLVAAGGYYCRSMTSHGPTSMLRDIEKITGVSFPSKYTALEIEAPTEFCYAGHMQIDHSESARFVREMNFKGQSDFPYLRSWGKYKSLFEDRQKVAGFLGASGNRDRKNHWEFAYDPSSGQMWFLMFYVLDEPRRDGSGTGDKR